MSPRATVWLTDEQWRSTAQQNKMSYGFVDTVNKNYIANLILDPVFVVIIAGHV